MGGASQLGRETSSELTDRPPTRQVEGAGLREDSNARRVAESALRESEARCRVLIEHSSDLVIEVRRDGRITDVNSRLQSTLGLDPALPASTNLLDLVHEADSQRVQALLLEPHTVFNFRLRSVDGAYRNLKVKATHFTCADGEENCLLVCRDLDERDATERALRESAALFTSTFRASPIFNTITEVETGLILDVNRSFENAFGYTRDEVVGSTTVGLGLWADATDRQAFLQELRTHGSIRAFEALLRFRNGEFRTCLMSAERVDLDGRSCMINVIEDISERRAAERALRESEDKFHKAFQTSPHPQSIADFSTGILIEVNEAYQRVSGYTREQLLGHSAVELGMIDADQRERAIQHWARADGTRDFEFQIRTARGEQRTVLGSAELIDLAGRRCIILGVLDITEQRRIEAAKVQLENELRQVQKLEAIGTLAGGIAHDFNNILGAMLGYTEIAKLDATTLPSVIESLNEVQRSGERAKELVRQILTFSRRHPQERRPIRLQPVLDEVRRLLRSTLPATVRLTAEASPDAERVHADPTQMHQVLVNLATNAAHALHGAPGQVAIRLAAREIREGDPQRVANLAVGKYVELSVQDDGCGIDGETLNRIFEPFFSTKSPGEGTGLGLSVVHGIVEAHEGVIHVESKPGVGTTFCIFLPVFGEQVTDEAVHSVELRQGNRERILFIDDEPVLCSAAKKLLGRMNYIVTTETNAADAVRLFRADPMAFDLVLTDLTMPGMTGVDVAAQVLRSRPGIPLILATGFNASWTLDAVRALGIRDLVMKPLSVATLAEKIHSALRNH